MHSVQPTITGHSSELTTDMELCIGNSHSIFLRLWCLKLRIHYVWRDNDNWKYRTGYGHYSPGSKISEINWSKIIYFLVGPLETGNFWSGPGTFYTFLYKWMFEFLKILIRTGNFFSLVMNTAHDWCFYSLESLRCIPRIQVVADGSLSIFNRNNNINIQGNFCISHGNGSSDNLPENLV